MSTKECMLREMSDAKQRFGSAMEPLGSDQLVRGSISWGEYACRACGLSVVLEHSRFTLEPTVAAASLTECVVTDPSAEQMLSIIQKPLDEL